MIFKARSQTLDIKTQRKWKYTDNLCTGCNVKEETGQEILVCEQFNDKNRTNNESAKYSDIYSENVIDIVETGKILQNNLKRRQELLEAGVTWKVDVWLLDLSIKKDSHVLVKTELFVKSLIQLYLTLFGDYITLLECECAQNFTLVLGDFH